MSQRETLRCPVCGNSYVHIRDAGVYQGESVTEVTGRRTVVIEMKEKPKRRGSITTVRFVCESGHGFEISYEFHKGQIEVSCTHTGDFDLAGEWPDTLWRD